MGGEVCFLRGGEVNLRVAARTCAQRDRDRQLFAAIADNRHLHGLTGLRVGGEVRHQRAHARDRRAVQRRDDVDVRRLDHAVFVNRRAARRVLQARLPRRASRIGAGHDDAARVVRQVERLNVAEVDVLPADAEVAVLHRATADQRLRDPLRQVGRDSEADAGIAARLAQNLRVHADHLPVEIEQRAAAVAGVDRGIRLDHRADLILVEAFNAPPQRADDARRHRPRLVEGAADGDHFLTDEQRVRIGERERAELFRREVNLDDGEVGIEVDADDFTAHNRAVDEVDFYPRRAFDNVRVGNDVPFGVDHKAGARAFDDLIAEAGIALHAGVPRRHIDRHD